VSGTIVVSNFPATQPVSGTITANQGTSPWVVSLASTTITGSVAVTGTFWQATQPVSGTITANQGTSPWVVSNGGTFAVQASITTLGQQLAAASVPVVLTAAQITALTPLSTVSVTQGTSPWVVSLASTTITGTVAENLTQVAGVVLGATAVTAYGTAPAAANVPGVNAFITNTPAVTISTGAGPVGGTGSSLNVNVTNTAPAVGTLTNNNAAPAATNFGVLPALANAANPTWTEGDQVLLSEDLSGHLRVVATGAAATGAAVVGNPVLVAGKVIATGFAQPLAVDGLGGVYVSGLQTTIGDAVSNTVDLQLDDNQNILRQATLPYIFNGTTWDRARSAGVFAGSGVASTGIAATVPAGQYSGSAPPVSFGQYIPLQTDYAGSLFVKPIRRSTTAASTAIISSSSAAVTVMPAQAAGIFADISSLVVTTTPAATVSLPFTLTLSDGTATYVWDMETGALATSSADGTLLNLAFNPPLPATTAATAWTIATNVATVTVHAVAVAVLQKAS
jgi:hypothetical protein